MVVAGVAGELEHWPIDSALGEDDDERDLLVASRLCEASVATLKGAIEMSEPTDYAKVERLKAQFFKEFGDSSLSGVCPVDPLIRCTYGEAEILLKPDARPVSLPQ